MSEETKEVEVPYEKRFEVLPEHLNKVPGKTRVTYNEQEYVVRKCTRDTMYAFIAYEQERQRMIQEASEKFDSGNGEHLVTQFGPRPTYDRYNYYVDLLKFILIGDMSNINEDTLDQNEAEQVILNFLPESMRLVATLSGF